MSNENVTSTKSFQPSLIWTLIALIVLGTFVALGLWQLTRYEQKKVQLNVYRARLNSTPITLDKIQTLGPDLRYFPITMTGHYINDRNLLLDNIVHKKQVGYQVLTLFLPEHSEKTIYVNRGWIPLGKNRESLPVIKNISGMVTVTGLIGIPPNNPYVPDQVIETTGKWPMRILAIDIPQLAKATKQDLYPFIVLLDQKDPNGFARDWTPTISSPHKNLAYAIQWFAMAIVTFILYIVLSIRRKEQTTDEQTEDSKD